MRKHTPDIKKKMNYQIQQNTERKPWRKVSSKRNVLERTSCKGFKQIQWRMRRPRPEINGGKKNILHKFLMTKTMAKNACKILQKSAYLLVFFGKNRE